MIDAAYGERVDSRPSSASASVALVSGVPVRKASSLAGRFDLI